MDRQFTWFQNQKPQLTKDGVEIRIGSLPSAQKMFFYERKDGSIFNTEEKEASKIHNKFRLVGVSDGTHYSERIKELSGKISELSSQEIREEMQKAWNEELELSRGKVEVPQLKPLNLNSKDQIFGRFKDSVN